MSLRQLSLTDFRNLQSCTLDFHQDLNLITGDNAAGKTSLLESIHIICQGRSFRTSRLDECIQHEKSGFLLFANFTHYKSGISRNSKETRIRIDGEPVSRLSSLAENTPVRIIDSASFELVTGSPRLKREYIDWCLFHVEHEYQGLWLLFNHALKQRNALLRQKRNYDQLDYWDTYICEHSKRIYDLRTQYINLIKNLLDKDFSGILHGLDIQINYSPGWNTDFSLEHIYKKSRDKDIKYGYTQYGVHRDNIEIMSNNYPVKQELSRGQLKRLTIALILSQIILIKQITKKPVILLIDDIHAELDNHSIKLTSKIVKNLNLQIFMTGISNDFTSFPNHQEFKMFHVEHGMIRTVKNS